MMDGNNQAVFEELLSTGGIRVKRSALFQTAPTPPPPGFDFDRVEGMLLGLAVGDALGNTTEAQFPSRRREERGEIRDYLPNRYANHRRVGLPSDDSQLAFWTLEQMLADGRFVPDRVADCFCRRRIFGIGEAVSAFVENRRAGKPWFECGPPSLGNGSLMRIAPMIVPHLFRPSTDLWVDTALSAMITHNEPGAIAACVAFVSMLWELLGMDSPPQPDWWPTTYVRVARELEGDTAYRPRNEHVAAYEGPLWRFIQERLLDVVPRVPLTVREACNQWYSGAYLLETVPSVLYILMCHGHDPEEAIVRAVNDTKDNDSIAAIVGAAVGALHGKRRLPPRWIDNLLGRTTDQDDGRVFELIEAARRKWWQPGRD